MTRDESSPTTVLLADDDVLTRLSVAEYLRGCGFLVIEAAGGDEAKTILLKGPPIDLLFADAELADPEGGFGLARWARRYKPEVSVMLIAGVVKKAEAAERLCPKHAPAPYASGALLMRIQSLKGRAKRSEGLRSKTSKVAIAGRRWSGPHKRTG